jgi:hypothetical protein
LSLKTSKRRHGAGSRRTRFAPAVLDLIYESRYFARTSSHTLYTGWRKRSNLGRKPSSQEQCQTAGTMKCAGGKASHPLLAAPTNRRDISVPRDAAHLGEILLTIDHRRIREGKALADVVTTSSNRPSLESYTLAGEVTGEKAKRTRYGERRWAFVVRGG